MPGLLPLFAALLLTISSEEVAGRFAQPALPLLLAALLALWTLFCALGARAVARRGEFRGLLAWDTLALCAAVAAQGALCHGWGWAQRVPGQLPAVLPFIVLLLVHWWTMTAAVRSITGTPWTPLARLLHQVRFSALPPAIAILGIADLADLAFRLAETRAPAWLEQLGVLAMVAGLVLLGPWLLIKLWGARPLEDSPLTRRLAAICARSGVPVRALLRWPIPGGRMHNALVFGLVPRMRYVLLTDDLLKDLDEDELAAVLGHELGHVRYGHLHLIMLFALAVIGVVYSLSASGDLASLQSLPVLRDLDPALSFGLLAVLGFVLAWRVLFGVISRACERQADLAGAEIAGHEAMRRALKSVARLSGQPEDAPSWRHHSIAERVAFLDLAQRNAALAPLHHRLVGSMRLSLIVLLVVFAMTMAWSFLADGSRDPAAAVAGMARNDPSLASALQAADEQDSAPLASWYSRADQRTRQTFAALQLALCAATATPAKGEPRPGDIDRAIYRFRHRLAALVGVTSGRPELDIELENALAYGLVAGDARPSEADLRLAQSLLPRLEAWQAKQPSHAIADTIACLHYVAGDDAKARDGWTFALGAMAKDRELSSKERERTQPLYQNRLDAAQGNLAAPGRVRPPLPLEWAPAETAAAAAPAGAPPPAVAPPPAAAAPTP